jgi:predicted GIY-YIG superfamily endonuclease
MPINVYVLELEGGNYYVGKAEDVNARFQEHMNKRGSAWTRLHTPLRIAEIRSGVHELEEDKVTKEYMLKYGIDKVRGGSYVLVDLDDFQVDALRREFWSATDCCNRCGRKGHFVNACRATTFVSGEKIDEEDDEDDEDGEDDEDDEDDDDDVTCYLCGRPGHYANNCQARSKRTRGDITHVEGYELDSKAGSSCVEKAGSSRKNTVGSKQNKKARYADVLKFPYLTSVEMQGQVPVQQLFITYRPIGV